MIISENMGDFMNKSKGFFCNKLTKILEVLILLFPILDQYAGISSHVSLGELTLIFLIFLLTFVTRKTVWKIGDTEKIYISFLVMVILLSVFVGYFTPGFSFESALLLWIRMVVYALFIKYASDYIGRKEKLVKLYLFFCIVLCLYLFIQYIGYLRMGKIFSNYIPFFSVKSSLINYALRDMEYVYSVSFRPSSLLSEPAKLAQYIAPGLVFLLFGNTIKNSKKRWLLSCIITAGLLLSTSFMGGLICVIVYGIYFLQGKLTKEKIFILAFACILFVFIYFKTDLITRNISRISNGVLNSSGTSSAALRLLRGWEIYFKLPVFNEIFGVGLNNLANFLNNSELVIKYGGNYIYGEYCSTITYILNCCGFVGFIPFVLFLISCFKKSDKEGKVLVFLIFAMSFGSSFLVTPTWVLFFTMIFLCKKQSRRVGYEY